MKTHDYIVVDAGSADCVLASRWHGTGGPLAVSDLSVETEALVTRVLFEGKRASGCIGAGR